MGTFCSEQDFRKWQHGAVPAELSFEVFAIAAAAASLQVTGKRSAAAWGLQP